MIGLLRAEARRMLSRRFFRFLAVLGVVAILIVAVIFFIRGSKDPNSGLAEARREVAACERSQAQFAKNPRIAANPGFEQFSCPTVQDVRPSYDRRFRYAEQMPNATRGVAIPLFILSFIVGASFVGAEWGTGSMATFLTWEPRRGRVLAAKVTVSVILLAFSAAMVLALLAAVFWPVGALRGTTHGATAAWWRGLSGIWLRAAGLGGFGAALGVGLAMLTRNTAGAVGVGLAYNAVLDQLLAQLWHGRFRIWLFQHNLPRLLGFPVEVPQRAQSEGPGVTLSTQMTLSITRPAVLLTLYAAGLLLLAFAAFRARDVT